MLMAEQGVQLNDMTSQARSRMYTHILVALDGSERAERVLPHVEALAEKFGTTVTLLRATTSAEALMPTPVPTAGPLIGPAPVIPAPVDPTAIVEAQQHAATNYLSALAERLRGQNVAVNYEQYDGPVAEVIVERARALGADLIAMTTHGRGGLERVVLGSIAEEVIRNAPCPVLLVRISE
jgi:nucleotide-binding universal stress UspA family protein